MIHIFHAPEMEIMETIDLVSYPGLIESDAYHAAHTGTKHVFWYYEPVWSPDGRYLAFLGAIEGPSSDVYVYDTATDRVQRLTSAAIMQQIWSGHRIVCGSSIVRWKVLIWAVLIMQLGLYLPMVNLL